MPSQLPVCSGPVLAVGNNLAHRRDLSAFQINRKTVEIKCLGMLGFCDNSKCIFQIAHSNRVRWWFYSSGIIW